ncbi:MAG: efflux RND transporter periplasmic adaptor subunit [Opitutaceae bacterium]
MAPRLLLLLAVLPLAGCGRPAPAAPAAPPAARIQVATVAASTRAIPVRIPGTVSRRTEAALAFKVGGLVEMVAVRAGDRVAAGQLLARLDPAEIEAQLAQARSGLEKALRDLARAEELRTRDAVSTELAQNAATGVEQAEAALRIAEFNRRHAEVVAPATGRILKRLVEPNDMVPANKVAVLFAADDEGWIARAGLPEAEAARLQIGDPATARSAHQPLLTGRLAQIAEATDPATHTVEVEVRLDAAPTALRTGSVVDLELQPADVAARPLVPITALVEGDGRQAALFLVSPDGRTVARRKVVVQTVHDGAAYLEGSLPAETRVATTGAEFLRDGATVEIVP